MEIKSVTASSPLSFQMKEQSKGEVHEKLLKGIEEIKQSDNIKETISDEIDTLNESIGLQFTNLKFEFHEDSERYSVKVINKETEEVIREIPPEEFLDMIAKMTEFLGILIDKKI